MTLAECQAECNRHDTCFGVEFESGLTVDNSPGLKDCIMIRRADTFVDCDSVHGANCDGWVIYGKPGAEPHGPGGDGNEWLPPDNDDWPVIATDSRVADPEEDRYESPWEWRSGEMTLGECKAEVRARCSFCRISQATERGLLLPVCRPRDLQRDRVQRRVRRRNQRVHHGPDHGYARAGARSRGLDDLRAPGNWQRHLCRRWRRPLSHRHPVLFEV